MITNLNGEYDFLSNHYASTFFHEGVKYKSVTHAYQALKCKYATDAALVRACQSPEEAVKKARTCATRDDWQTNCMQVMYDLLKLKFDNVFLRPKLQATGNVEINTGRNFLGTLLMKIRDEINDESKQNE